MRCYTEGQKKWRLIFIALNILYLMIGATLIGIGTWLVTRGFDYTFISDYFYALLYILPGIFAVLLSLVGIFGTLGMWYRVHTWVSCYNYPLVLV
jgi:hypothetical protein